MTHQELDEIVKAHGQRVSSKNGRRTERRGARKSLSIERLKDTIEELRREDHEELSEAMKKLVITQVAYMDENVEKRKNILTWYWKMWKGLDPKKSINDLQYREHVEHALSDRPNLRDAFVKFLTKNKDFDEASRWQHFTCKTTTTGSPSIVRYELDGYVVKFMPMESHDDILNATNILKNCDSDIIAIDFENRPYYICSGERVALLQVALGNQVLLIDMLSLERSEHEVEWFEFFETLFSGHQIKIGFSISGDIRVLSETFPSFAKIERNYVVDLRKLAHRLRKGNIDDIALKNKLEDWKTSDNLAALAEACLGEELDKTEQLSNFDMRPLRKAQMDYAARDATILLEILKRFDSVTIGTTRFKNYLHQVKMSSNVC
ncbi:hypothetical protein QR680_015421 [Steinernema hermaphroditum]|uniref:3'-5' exonuclease domain-containing protein n=1 Tax=Steinernema hermaphroditum TaxID=289476 RepID=A0AA39LK65_9BILA|nr:hypothetical protein QR680_015421 [Steinernema hermaphroditum]